MAEPLLCPCCSGKAYAACCRPIHKEGVAPPDAEALMRSRYSAFALKQTDHLVRTLHSSHPDAHLRRETLVASLKRNCNRHRYPKLEILRVENPNANGEAFVT